MVLCPYCGELSRDAARCEACRGNFDPLSRQATQNSMGPWFVRDPASPHRPGCSIEVVRALVRRGKVGAKTVLRGPTTNQFWSLARRAPGVANLLGVCHNCGGPAGEDDVACLSCGATFRYHDDRQHLGLTEVRLLPGQASPEVIAALVAPSSPGGAGAGNRPVAPRTSGPGAAFGAGAGDRSVEPGGAADRPSSARWMLLLGGVIVLGAFATAAWIMNRLPGFPSPILAQPETERPLTNGEIPDASHVTQAEPPVPAEPGPEGSAQASHDIAPAEPEPGSSGVDPPSESGLEVAHGLLRQGDPASLRDAIRLADEAGGSEAATVIRRAAHRLLEQMPLRGLP
jgi:hypothetical protein